MAVVKIEARPLREHRYRAANLLSQFTVPYLREAYREFDGDLVMLLVLGEIALRNVGPLFASNPWSVPLETTPPSMRESHQLLRPCNALSVSEATGIPRETVRRKVAVLLGRGWLQRNRRGHLYLTAQVVRRFEAFTQERIASFLEVAEGLRALIAPERGPRR